MKKALVTGGAGFIGLNIARRLIKDGVKVDLADNFSRGKDDNELAAVRDQRGARIIKLDLSEPGSTDALDTDYDAIFHCAAILGVARVILRPYETLALNVALTTEALRLASRQKNLSSFVFASTSEVYAGSHLAGLLEFPTPEDSLLVLPPLTAPRTAYMLSKIYGEALVHQAGVPGVIIRPHNIYGPRMGVEHVVPELMKRMIEAMPGSDLVVHSPSHRRTFCYIDDAVEIIARLATAPSAVGGVWNVGSEAPEHTIMDVAGIIHAIVGADVNLVSGEDTAGSPTRRCPSMVKTNAITGHCKRFSLEEGARRTFAWYRDRVFTKAKNHSGVWPASRQAAESRNPADTLSQN